MMASAAGMVGLGQWVCSARLTPNFDILRLTTRGAARKRRGGSSSKRNSVVAWQYAAANASGGKARVGGGRAARHPERASERQSVGVGVGLQRDLVHQPADGMMHAEIAIYLLDYPLGILGPQYQAGAALMGLELVEGQFELPALGIGGSQFPRRGSIRVEDGGEQAVARFSLRPAGIVEGVLNHTHGYTLSPMTVRAGVEVGQVGSVSQALLGHQHVVRLGAPEQVGAAAPSRVPERKAVEAAISQTEHASTQRGEHRGSQALLPHRVGSQRGVDQGVAAALGQAD